MGNIVDVHQLMYQKPMILSAAENLYVINGVAVDPLEDDDQYPMEDCCTICDMHLEEATRRADG